MPREENLLILKMLQEGTITAEQAAELVRLGCASVQGYYFSRPVPADDVRRERSSFWWV